MEKTNASPRKPLIDFDIPAIIHSLRHHKNLSAEDVRRESLLKMEAEKKLFRNLPLCRFARKVAHESEVVAGRLQQWKVKKVHRFEDRLDKMRGTIALRSATAFIDTDLPTIDRDYDGQDEDHSHSRVLSRRAARRAKITPLYDTALANSSTENLRARLAANCSRKLSEEKTITMPKSVEIVQLVPHEAQSAVRHARASTNLPAATLEALLNSGSSTAVNRSGSSSPVSASSQQWFNDASSPQDPRKSCMRYPKTRKQEWAIFEAAEGATVAIEEGIASCYVPLTSSRRLSSLSLRGRRRMVSVSYHDGNQEIGSPTIEGEDGVRRPRLVVFQFGEGVDEMIPGKSLYFPMLTELTYHFSQEGERGPFG